MADLPSNVEYATVRARFLRAVLDTDDAGTDPDGIPLAGLQILFTPALTPAVVKVPRANPPATIQVMPFTLVTDSEGYLSNPIDNERFVKLIASNGAEIEPSGWSYTVTITGEGFPSQNFSIILSPGQNLDLTTAVPVPTNPGTTLPAWVAAVNETQANMARAETAATTATNARNTAVSEAAKATTAAAAAASMGILPISQPIPANWPTRLVVRTEA